MLKVRKILAAAVAIIALAVLGVLDHRQTPVGEWRCENGAWRKEGRPQGLPPETGCPPTTADTPAATDCATLITKDAKADAPYWKATGHLGRGGACMKVDTWYLRYEMPAGPRQLEVAFAADADCRVDDVTADCAKMNPPSGSQTVLDGTPDGAVFRVTKLQFRTK